MQNIVYPRWQEVRLKDALKTRRILFLAGPRQCGKTSLSNILTLANTIYRSLDDQTLLASALSDPQGFVRHGNELMIIDEVQRAPILLPAIKQNVDVFQNPGRFLLTGSANIQSLPGVTESLAGRIRKIRLRPLTQGERRCQGPMFLAQAFQNIFEHSEKTHVTKDDYIQMALQGGYPEAVRMTGVRETRHWHLDYLEALMERDLKDIINIKRKDSMDKLLEVLAAWSSKFIDLTAIGSSLSLARPTIESYINALEALYVVERVRAWAKTDYDRVSKQDKLFMADTGLMSSILGWQLSKVCLNDDINGKLLETFVFTELIALIEAQEEIYQLYHYRDREKREIDFIVQHESGALLGIEVKSGSAITRDHFKHLKWFKSNMAKEQPFIGIILYSGQHLVPFGPNFWAVPMSALWNNA